VAKTTLVDADTTLVSDSEDSNKSKKVSWLNVWNYIKGKFYVGLTSGRLILYNGTAHVSSLLRDNGTTVGIGATTAGYGFDLSAMSGMSIPFPVLTTAPGSVPTKLGIQGVDNGSNTGAYYVYMPYASGGNPAGWYTLLTSQNNTFTALATSGKSLGIATDTSMANSYSTPPTNSFNPEWRAFYFGTGHRAIGIYQGGGGYQFTKKEDGKTWAYVAPLNSYLLDWDGSIIASTANGGKGNAGSQVNGALRSFNSRFKVAFMSNNNSPYYYVSGYVDVDSNGNCVTWYSEQDSTNTSSLQAVITGGKLQFNGNVGDAVYVFVEKLTGMYGNLYTTFHTKQKYSADSQTQYWIGTGGFAVGSTISSDSIFEAKSTTKGIRFTEYTFTAMNALTGMSNGVKVTVVEGTNKDGIYIYNSTYSMFLSANYIMNQYVSSFQRSIGFSTQTPVANTVYGMTIRIEQDIIVTKMGCFVVGSNGSETWYLDIYDVSGNRLTGGTLTPSTANDELFCTVAWVMLKAQTEYKITLRSNGTVATFAQRTGFGSSSTRLSWTATGVTGASPSTLPTVTNSAIQPFISLGTA